MGGPRRSLAGALVVALSLSAAACSSGPSVPSASVSKADITQAYKTLFNFNNKSVDAKVAVIQDGSAVRSTLSTALSSSLASAAGGASVSAVTELTDAQCTTNKVPAPCAQATYSILAPDGSSLLANQKGYASYSTGKWLVAKVTICQLLGLFYAESGGGTKTPPGCGS